MKQHLGFALLVSFFNCVGFVLFVGGATYVDSRLATRIAHGPREYPLGYFALLGVPVVFLLTLASVLLIRNWQLRSLAPVGSLAIPSLLILPNFLPEFPHMGIVWSLYFSVATLLACLIRFYPQQHAYLTKAEILPAARVEFTKESASLWRVISIGLAVGYIGILVGWLDFVWEYPSSVVTDPAEKELLSVHAGIGVAFFSVYVLIGPVFQALSRWRATASLLLRIQGDQGSSMESDSGWHHND